MNEEEISYMKKNGCATKYVYSASGEKLRATHLTAVPNITVPVGSARDLVSSEILGADSTDYLLGGSLTMRNGRIDNLQSEEGYSQAAEYHSLIKTNLYVTRWCIGLILLLLALSACTREGGYDALLNSADSLVNIHPDSVIQLLEPLNGEKGEMTTAQRMRWQLLLTSAQNKCDTVFNNEDIQLELVKYYDRQGSPNERMTAHYLLGRAYSDMGKVAQALQCFLDAVECADTTSQDCDFNTLFPIYGQMAMVYQAQCLPEEELASWNQYSHYAMKSGDKYNYIRGMELMIGPYFNLGDTVSCLHITETCREEYARQGRPQEAASVLPTAIDIHLLNSNYEKAREMMVIFERESGLFDSNGNISKGREGYYYSKGLYYLGIDENDSAEYYFRKLQRFHLNHDYKANKGLLSLYKKENNIDSISKYAEQYVNSVDALLSENHTDAVAITHSLYNYNKMERMASEKTMVSERMKTWGLVIALICLMSAIAVIDFYSKQKRKRKADVARRRQLKTGMAQSKEAINVNHSHENVIPQNDINEMKGYINELTEKLDESRRLTSEAIAAKDEEIRELTTKYKGFDKFLNNMTKDDVMKTIQQSDIIREFKFYVEHPVHPPSTEDWTRLDRLFHDVHPNFPLTLQDTCHLNTNEYRVCQLVFAGISPSGIAVLMGFDKSNVTNIRKRLLTKLMGKNGKASEFDQFLFSIPLL